MVDRGVSYDHVTSRDWLSAVQLGHRVVEQVFGQLLHWLFMDSGISMKNDSENTLNNQQY